MKVSLLNPPPIGLIEEHVAEIAAICFSSPNPTNTRRVERLVLDKTLSPFRHWLLTVKFEGISIPCARQLFRHVHTVQDSGEPVFEGSTEQSKRYVDASDIEFITPPSIRKIDALATGYKKLMDLCQMFYRELRANNIPKGDARYCLPQAMTTDVFFSANPEAWFNFCRLRTDKHAQWEIRELAHKVTDLLTPHIPTLFSSIEWPYEET